jgi:hypothetical protein
LREILRSQRDDTERMWFPLTGFSFSRVFAGERELH